MKLKKHFSGLGKRMILFFCLLSFLLFATNAFADFYYFNLTIANSGLNGGLTDDYARVTVELTDASLDQATITFEALAGYKLKNNQLGVQLNVNSTNFVSNPLSDSGNISEFGFFNATYGPDGGIYDSFSFTIDNNSGIDWQYASDVLVPNWEGYLAAAHMIPVGADGKPTGASTGYAAGPGNPVPIPAAIWLLGSGLIGLVGLRRRFRK